MNKVKNALDEIGWSGWLVVERSRDKNDPRNVMKNFGTNIDYLKQIFQNETFGY
jgi:sugar phosphate isomerase/epimerase